MKWMILIFSLFLAQSVCSERITAGVSPSIIELDNLIPGSDIQRTITITKSSPGTLQAVLEFDEDWIVADNTLLIENERNKVNITIQIPNDALGMHESRVTIRLRTLNDNGLNPELVLPIHLSLNVSNETFLSYKIRQAKVTDTISLVVDNLGNVKAGPEYAVIEISDYEGNSKEYRKDIYDKIQPFSKGTINIDLDNQEIGNYWAVIKVYDDGLIRTFEAPLEITGASLGNDSLRNLTFIILAMFVVIMLVRRWTTLDS